MPVQTIFIRSQCYGQPVVRVLEQVRETMQTPCGKAWFCEQCGEVWARAVVSARPFRVLSAPCEEHNDGLLMLRVPGSILIPLDNDFNNSLPLEVWKREFELHTRFFERQNQT